MWRKARSKIHWHWKVFLVTCIIFIGPISIIYLGFVESLIIRLFGKIWWVECIVYIIVFIISYFISTKVLYHKARPYIREILKDQNK